MSQYENGEIISERWGLPSKDVSCPACGNIYGRYNRKVCTICQECSRCCLCPEPAFVEVDKALKLMGIIA
jgi:hypothetical protein